MSNRKYHLADCPSCKWYDKLEGGRLEWCAENDTELKGTTAIKCKNVQAKETKQ